MRGTLQCVLHACRKSSGRVSTAHNASGARRQRRQRKTALPTGWAGLTHASTLPPTRDKALIVMLQMYIRESTSTLAATAYRERLILLQITIDISQKQVSGLSGFLSSLPSPRCVRDPDLIWRRTRHRWGLFFKFILTVDLSWCWELLRVHSSGKVLCEQEEKHSANGRPPF